MSRSLRPIFRLVLILISLSAAFTLRLDAQSDKIDTATFTALAANERVRVIVTLDAPGALTASPADRRSQVTAVQDAVLNRFQSPGLSGGITSVTANGITVRRRFSQIPAFTADVDSAALTALLADPRVLYIQADEPGGAAMTESVPAIHADVVHNSLGLTGAGVRAAVLDSGIDTDHPDLADDLIGQRCFTGAGVSGAGTCPPGNTNTGTSAEDANGHGTNVAGIITSKGTIAPLGFAPDADIFAIRVLDGSGSGWLSDWIAALDWLAANQETLNIDVVNMSIGSFSAYSAPCDAQQPAFANAVNLLVDTYDVTIFSSTGNQGNAVNMAAPACIAKVIAVGATYDSDLGREPDTGTWQNRFGSGWPTCFDATTSLNTLACFTNGGTGVDVVAPGVYITSTGIGGGTSRYAGTSQASPTTAGVAALMLQARPALAPATIENILKSTGVSISDPRNGLIYPRIDALAAVQSALTLFPTPVQTSPVSHAITGVLPTFTWTDVPGTEAYFFWLMHSDGSRVYKVWLNPADYCSAGVCTFTSFFDLDVGSYRWRVQGWSGSQGYSEWSPAALFEVQ